MRPVAVFYEDARGVKTITLGAILERLGLAVTLARFPKRRGAGRVV